MNSIKMFVVTLLLASWLTACGDNQQTADSDAVIQAPDEMAEGPHGGRLLTDNGFSVELAIHEAGVPPEYRAWVYQDGVAVSPQAVDLRVTLSRLGGAEDDIGFTAQDEMLRGDTTVYEPHSFSVNVQASYQGQSHQWSYDSFEGHTHIEPEARAALGIATEQAGPVTMAEQITVYGHVRTNTDQVAHVGARFDGEIEQVHAGIGDHVDAGQPLLEVESNESLNRYTVTAPISGLVTQRDANAGEQTNGRDLLVITDLSSVWVDLAIFPDNRADVRVGMAVTIHTGEAAATVAGTIAMILPQVQSNQAVTARVVLDNSDRQLIPGTWVSADIRTGEFEVPLAVRREALQSFRDFTVVYAQFGNDYEVRMLDLGRQSGDWAEVLGGLAPGTRYVTENSYIIKADVEKSGASHDH
ncbi:efflux RND transporter periplasmic adaptor subunit [Pseudohongiella sp.]|uniref:RND efflux pump membrane fusion protein barrel-sandwich domain-containing protein n=1 Tax=marine sediment metagenome TaxID=412755 RepID=A0A0F9W9U5_9ZZZZ|nr:efflux RND transporter periplasmic adaptor subunit [Pseudohongiella sp.]